MDNEYLNEQESFWAGEFGSTYINRNSSEDLLSSNIAFFTKALRSAHKPKECIEFGANIGLNLIALKSLFPQIRQYAIEINETACNELKKFLPQDNVFQTTILNYHEKRIFDLVLTKTVLIHINPDYLPIVYEKLYNVTGRYLLICEYYNPYPTMVPYRGHTERLFKRDFCGEILDQYCDMNLLDYGFTYHRDINHPQDDINWFLLEKIK